MIRKRNHDERRWTWPAVLSVGAVLLLLVVGALAFIAVTLGWIEPPPSPEGTYPTGVR